jgi:hypothetical protein
MQEGEVPRARLGTETLVMKQNVFRRESQESCIQAQVLFRPAFAILGHGQDPQVRKRISKQIKHTSFPVVQCVTKVSEIHVSPPEVSASESGNIVPTDNRNIQMMVFDGGRKNAPVPAGAVGEVA